MITYCGLRHFYIRHFTPSQADSFYILTYNKNIWDFSPELKQYGFTGQNRLDTVYHYEKPVFTVPIKLADFQPFAHKWYDFSRQYTDALEPEYPHSWYLRFQRPKILEQFIADFNKKLQKEKWEGIWGTGFSKIVAKLAAHNLPQETSFIAKEQTEAFLKSIPLKRLPLPELESLSKLGVKTIGELNHLPLTELISQFGNKAKTLQLLGRGEDLVPFQNQSVLNFKWELDCTTLEGFFRPLTPHELKPYIEQGAQKLSAALSKHNQTTNLLQLKAILPSQTTIQTQRRFKEHTNDPQMLKRAAEGIIPKRPLAHLTLTVSELEKAFAAQLNMFFTPTAHLPIKGLPAQRGVELSRRESLLLLWKEHFHYE